MARKSEPKHTHAQITGGGRVRRGDGPLARMDSAGEVSRSDGWANVLTSQRTSQDYRQHTRFNRSTNLSVTHLESLYRGDALTRRIVDSIPNLITRDPWTLDGDTDNDVWQYLDDRKFMQYYRRCLKWGRLYGGGVIVLGVNDGGDLEEPLNPNRIRGIDFFRVYDRYCMIGSVTDWNRDPNNARFGMREWYTIYPRGVIIPQASFRVHYSRIIQCDGVTTTDVQLAKNYGWSDSLMEVIYEDIKRFVTGIDDSSAVIRDFVQGVLSIKNLSNYIGNQDGETKLKNRLGMMDLTRHMLNTMITDEGETYTKVSSSVAGLGDVIDRLGAMVSVASETPQSVLFGRAPQGMNATGEMDIRSWYDACSSNRRETVAHGVIQVANLVVKARDYTGKWKGPEQGKKITPKFAALWTPTDKETAELRLAIAQADHIYITDQVLSPEEVADSRFGGQSYSIDTTLAEQRNPAAPDPEADAAAAAEAAAAAAAAGGGGPPGTGPQDDPTKQK